MVMQTLVQLPNYVPSTLKITLSLLTPAGLEAVSVYVPSTLSTISDTLSSNKSSENDNLLLLDIVMSCAELLCELVKVQRILDSSTSGEALSILKVSVTDRPTTPKTDLFSAITVGGTKDIV